MTHIARPKHVLVESDGIMHAHRRGVEMKEQAPKNEKELRTVKQPRKPGQGTPQNPPSKDVGRDKPKEEQ